MTMDFLGKFLTTKTQRDTKIFIMLFVLFVSLWLLIGCFGCWLGDGFDLQPCHYRVMIGGKRVIKYNLCINRFAASHHEYVINSTVPPVWGAGASMPDGYV